jgi:uncharacterized YigZ family protein
MGRSIQSDFYKTPLAEARAELLVHGSRFIAFIAPSVSDSDVTRCLATVKRTYHDAAHHCYASILITDTELQERLSDAGEPSGTAGKPILAALHNAHLINTVCVVVRYFGGIKLGVGGLRRAYSTAAKSAIQSATIVEKYIMRSVRIAFPYDMTGQVERLLDECNAEITERMFQETPQLVCTVRAGQYEAFLDNFCTSTRGKGIVIE